MTSIPNNFSADTDKNYTIAKTILGIIPLIDRYCEASAKMNRIRAFTSFNGFDDTAAVMDKIIEHTFRSDRLHNLKVKTNKLLDAMPANQGRAVRLYFLEAKTAVQAAAAIGCTERSVFRLIQKGVAWVGENLGKIGINYFTFKELLTTHKWIRAEFEKNLAGIECDRFV